MRTITLLPPVREGRQVNIRWQVDPPCPLYRNPQCYLRFPADVNLDRVPPGAWWAATLLMLAPHWPLLRPCRVVLPVRLSPAEQECLLRWLDAGVVTLETYRGTSQFERQIEIHSQGRPWHEGGPVRDTGRCATAYSSGKDSLLQTGILCELTQRPVLVATTSPLPGMNEHVNERRRQVLQAIPKLRDVTFHEVESDYRSCWDNDYARKIGYTVSVNELCDTLLYTASLLIVGLAEGAPHLFLASEAEVQENAEVGGRIVQHPHFMYSTPTLRAFEALFAPLGIRLCSMTAPLHSFQVQELLWTRYADLRHLQYSCWRMLSHEATCSRCTQCLRIGTCALAMGDRPARMGVDLVKLFPALIDFEPRVTPTDGSFLLPDKVTGIGLHAQLLRNMEKISFWHVLRCLAQDQPRQLLRGEGWRALDAFRRLQRKLARFDPGPRPGYREGFLAQVDPLVRAQLGSNLAEHFPPADAPTYAGVLTRSARLANHITDPLDLKWAAAA